MLPGCRGGMQAGGGGGWREKERESAACAHVRQSMLSTHNAYLQNTARGEARAGSQEYAQALVQTPVLTCAYGRALSFCSEPTAGGEAPDAHKSCAQSIQDARTSERTPSVSCPAFPCLPPAHTYAGPRAQRVGVVAQRQRATREDGRKRARLHEGVKEDECGRESGSPGAERMRMEHVRNRRAPQVAGARAGPDRW